MYDDKKDLTFANRHPQAWDSILEHESGQIITEQGLFTYSKVYPSVEASKYARNAHLKDHFKSLNLKPKNNDLFWIVISYTPESVLKERSQHLLTKHILITSLLLILVALGLWYALRALFLRISLECCRALLR